MGMYDKRRPEARMERMQQLLDKLDKRERNLSNYWGAYRLKGVARDSSTLIIHYIEGKWRIYYSSTWHPI